MSYIRWGSVCNSSMSLTDEMDLLRRGKTLQEVRQCQLKEAGTVTSDWYIYWHSMSGDDHNETRDDQYLAMWNRNSEKTPVWSYSDVKAMHETKNWALLGDDLTQIDILENCIERWLNDVKEKYKE